MATTRTIAATPYNGGSLRVSQPYANACVLTDSRIVWTYCQATPAWRFFNIVDTPGGWNSTGTPTITTHQMFDQSAWRGSYLVMQRLNDTTFITWDWTSTGAGIAEVFEVSGDNTVARTYSNTNLSFVGMSSNGVGTKFHNALRFIRTSSDNVLLAVWFSGGAFQYQTLTWNPTTKALTTGTATSFGSNAGSLYPEIYTKPVPGSSKFAVYTRWNSQSSYVNNASQAHLFNADGTFVASTALISGSGGTDLTIQSETRMSLPSWTRADYYNLAYTAGQGGGPYTNTSSTNALMAFPLTADYTLLIDRQTMSGGTYSANVFAKVIRREDSNIITQSAGSAATATGFKIAVPPTEFWWDKQRPHMLSNGDLMWFGTVAATTNQYMLTWTVVKSPV